MRLSDKVAVVTGASKGIGAAIACSLAAEGASILVNYASSKDAAEKVVAQITEAGGTAIAVKGDVSNEDEARQTTEAAILEYGRLDVLGLLLVTKHAVPRMSQGASIVNLSSLASVINPPGAVVYTAAKHAVDGITAQLAKELAPRGIRVNGVNPGLIETEGTRGAGFFGGSSGFAGDTDLGQVGTPEGVARIVTFLATGDSGWVTGQSIVANGPQFRVMAGQTQQEAASASEPADQVAVSPLKLLFDLVYVFAVSRLSGHLLQSLTWTGAVQTAVLTVAVYGVWASTSFEATAVLVRRSETRWILPAVMALGLFMNASIGGAFGDAPWAFVAPFLLIQLGRPMVTAATIGEPELRRHYVNVIT